MLCRDADRARELGEHDRAVRLYHRALRSLKSPPGSAPPSPRVSSVYERVASCERAMGRLASAIEALERSVRWDDGRPGGWMALGEARLEARRFEGAAEAFEAFCERCDASELERGRRMSRVARSMASGEGLGRGAEEEPRRREVPRSARPETREATTRVETREATMTSISTSYSMMRAVLCVDSLRALRGSLRLRCYRTYGEWVVGTSYRKASSGTQDVVRLRVVCRRVRGVHVRSHRHTSWEFQCVRKFVSRFSHPSRTSYGDVRDVESWSLVSCGYRGYQSLHVQAHEKSRLERRTSSGSESTSFNSLPICALQ